LSTDKNGDGRMFGYSSLQADSKVKSALQPGLRVCGHLALTDFRTEESKWALRYGFAS